MMELITKRKIFKKSDTRLIPLLAVEYWYRAENKVLPKLTRELVKYSPLFAYNRNRGKGVDVYYELNDWIIENNILAPYFQKNETRFVKLANEYKKECSAIKKTVSGKKLNLKKLFELFASAWAKLSFIVPLGELYYSGVKNNVTYGAVRSRRKTISDFYKANHALTVEIKLKLPKYKDFVNFLTFNEIINFKRISLAELKKRKKGYIFYKNKIYTGVLLEHFVKNKNFTLAAANNESDISGKSLLRGAIAMKGKVKGRVKIIFHQDQMNLVKNGDILVTPMTTTTNDCIMAMGRAAAFVTDEGGMTSHAAIIARELKKPCIVGTKVATKILKNDDFVEVDANSGMIRKIK